MEFENHTTYNVCTCSTRSFHADSLTNGKSSSEHPPVPVYTSTKISLKEDTHACTHTHTHTHTHTLTHTLASQLDLSACSSALAVDNFSEKASSSLSLSFSLRISLSRCWLDFCSWVNPSRSEENFARSLEGETRTLNCSHYHTQVACSQASCSPFVTCTHQERIRTGG